ncbi:MAG: hypothetical protein A3G93_12805 [Nitrospinae bacterium RIFCSPLOWO2_12_FULL_45_22]|nr:MAG: hypothetical protein A3G93_12805 [Nitrospinae bacterium RIFCSPLOWO2_12_FULL_45_22]
MNRLRTRVISIMILGVILAFSFHKTLPVSAQPITNILTGGSLYSPLDLVFTITDPNGLSDIDRAFFEVSYNGTVFNWSINDFLVPAVLSGTAQMKAVGEKKVTITFPGLVFSQGLNTLGIGLKDRSGNIGRHEVTLMVLPQGESLPTINNPDPVFVAIAEKAFTYLAAAGIEKLPYKKEASYLYGLLDDNGDGKIDEQDNPANDPFVLDARSKAEYERGHIPGAINIPFEELAKEENIDRLPTDREIIIVDRDHSLSQQLVMYFNLLGFNYHKVFNLKWGMVGWTRDSSIAPGRFTEDSRSSNNNFPIDSTTPKLEDGPVYPYPRISTSQTDMRAAVLERAKIIFPMVAKRWYMYTDELMEILDDDSDGALYGAGDDTSNDPFILDVLPPNFTGHVNIPRHKAMNWRDIPALASLQHLPPNRQIVPYCIPAGASEQITMLLNLLGYNAINLKWSTSAWNIALHNPNYTFKDDMSSNYPIRTGSNP